MVRSILNLAFGLLLASGQALAGDYCSSNKCQSMMKMTANDGYMRQYCNSMPEKRHFNRNRCPQALKSMSYDEIKTYCGCYKNTCMPTQCGYKTKCSKYPCGNYCADTKTDEKNCGECGKKCDYGKTCKEGKCKPKVPDCPYGKTACPDGYGNYKCIDKKTDEYNCGACGVKCKQGESCKEGMCKKDCPYGKTACPADYGQYKCTDTKTDEKNCGECGIKCKSDESCVYGQCKKTCPPEMPDQCPNPYKYGKLECVNKKTDNKNCGECGKECTELQMCKEGMCKCPADKPTECAKDCCKPTEQCFNKDYGGKICCTKDQKPCTKAEECCPGSKCDVPYVSPMLPRGLVTIPDKVCQPDCQMKDQPCSEMKKCCPNKDLVCKKAPTSVIVRPDVKRSPLAETIPDMTCQLCSKQDETCEETSDCCPDKGLECKPKAVKSMRRGAGVGAGMPTVKTCQMKTAPACMKAKEGEYCAKDEECCSNSCDKLKYKCKPAEPACMKAKEGETCAKDEECCSNSCDKTKYKCKAPAPECMKAKEGEYCAKDEECCSNSCDKMKYTCKAPAPECMKAKEGEYCAKDEECCSNSCDKMKYKCKPAAPACMKVADGGACTKDDECCSNSCDKMKYKCKPAMPKI